MDNSFYLKLSRKSKFLCSVWSCFSTVCVTVFFLIFSKKLLCSHASLRSIKCFHKSKVQQFVLFLKLDKTDGFLHVKKVTCFYYKLWFCVIYTFSKNLSSKVCTWLVLLQLYSFLNLLIHVFHWLYCNDIKCCEGFFPTSQTWHL